MQHDPSDEVNDNQNRPQREAARIEVYKVEIIELDSIEFVVLDVVTRAEMLATGDLVAVPPALAHITGFRAPVAITRAAWLALVHDPAADTDVPDDLNRPLTTHEMLHLRKVCHAATFTAARVPKKDLQGRDMKFTVSGETLWLHVGPDDDGAACFTIMRQEDW